MYGRSHPRHGKPHAAEPRSLRRQKTRIRQLDVFQPAAAVAEQLAGHGEGHLDIACRREDDRSLHAMIVQIGKQSQIQPRLPGRLRGAQRGPQQRMNRRRQPRCPRILALEPATFALPGIARQPQRLERDRASRVLQSIGWPSVYSRPSERSIVAAFVLAAAQRRHHLHAFAVLLTAFARRTWSAPDADSAPPRYRSRGRARCSTPAANCTVCRTLRHQYSGPISGPVDPPSEHRGEQRQRRRARLDAVQRRQQLVAHRIHLGAVESVLDLQKAAENLPLFQRGRSPPAARHRRRA